eukprot:CAMPEP_0198297096 /NCGR_PEP_ID=MMETSP1449-20131203/35392_1 /TAXON_ID=420275 /ORGANISM="Attheya septentrionalis, Strain CCMP2084" /LENGTH=750 /DNA_ID=CAMNT_0043997925 /DNA_START=249 /DNA_END=2501 /DNA_ORIENTATION=-
MKRKEKGPVLRGKEDSKTEPDDETEKTVEDVQRRIDDLRQQLMEASQELEVMKGDTNGPGGSLLSSSTIAVSSVHPAKRGYLFKWQDRSIGWGGTKWALRFVKLDRGMLSYFGSHEDPSPRYVLALRRCAVRDDGFKKNLRFKPKEDNPNPGPQVNGAYFHVFSIYQRPYEEEKHSTESSAAQDDDDDRIVPLLRFSTQKLAEKKQWIELLSQACAYCDTDDFLKEEATAIDDARKQSSLLQKGTLPPMYFATPAPRKLVRISSIPSSIHKAEDYVKTSKREKSAHSHSLTRNAYPPSKPMHRAAASSYISDFSRGTNYRGLFNLAIIILVVSNFRLLLDGIMHHGFVLGKILDLSHLPAAPLVDAPFVWGIILLHVFLVCSLCIEKLLSKGKLGEGFGQFLHLIVANASLIVPIIIIWYHIESPVNGSILLLLATITWMKLISYMHANMDYRVSPEQDAFKATIALIQDLDEDEANLSYPSNVTLLNMYYFWLAPTLTYQIAFPRSPIIRWWKVASLLLRLLISISLLGFLTAQIISPNLDNLVEDLEPTGGRITSHILAKYLLKVTIANTYAWLLVFYIYFHLCLNLVAEILRFGDRIFYRDWWNSSEISAYWRLWNMPVHYWLVRHIYFPCVRMKMSKVMATFVVFFISAVMHEVLISVPFHMIRPWSFLGMMAQIPLVTITKSMERRWPGGIAGNIIFWISFCIVGQPMAILLYTVDYRFGMHHDEPLVVDDPGPWWKEMVLKFHK